MENTTGSLLPDEPKSLGASLLFRLRAAFSKVNIQRRPRSLRLCETLPLGEKRLLAVVECESQRFLVGVTAHNISLLQKLGVTEEEDCKPEQP
jgi:flagellar biogenesis protein FliO